VCAPRVKWGSTLVDQVVMSADEERRTGLPQIAAGHINADGHVTLTSTGS